MERRLTFLHRSLLADAYVKAGLVPKYTIRNWMVVVGDT